MQKSLLLILLIKQQFVVTQTICQTQIPTLLYSWVRNTPAVKMLCPQQIASPYIFTKKITCLSHGLLMICHVFSVSSKTAYSWVMINCCFMRDFKHSYYFP